MGTLIDALLSLSRVSQTRPVLERVNLSELFNETAKGLLGDKQAKNVEIDIQPDIFANADKNLMQVVYTNLISNALKYSSNTADLTISFGKENQNNKSVYFVKDTGIGFDMANADTLFKPFQRIHQHGNYEGLGIGLATVERIIARHRGKIWAESKPGEGTVFYFCLGDNESIQSHNDTLPRAVHS
jgi:signal transduction histidine kinase